MNRARPATPPTLGDTSLMSRNSNLAGEFSFLVNTAFQNFDALTLPGYYGVGPDGPFTYTCFSCDPVVPAIPPLTPADFPDETWMPTTFRYAPTATTRIRIAKF